jgi:hypothetical protein
MLGLRLLSDVFAATTESEAWGLVWSLRRVLTRVGRREAMRGSR